MKNQLNICVEKVCRIGLSDGVFTGVSAGMSFLKNKVYNRGLFSGGYTRFDKEGSPVQRETLFDLASLTKPLCTTLCVLHLVATGKLKWDKNYYSSLTTEKSIKKSIILIQHLLNHSSGLPSYRPYFKDFSPEHSRYNINLIVNKILQEPLAYPTGDTSLYSDLGFILLGALIENYTGEGIDTQFRKIITDPLNLSSSLCFLPLEDKLKVNKKLIAATENCNWRNKLIHGEVHDENSWLMGGVAGHAGLFGNIEGVLFLCEYLLDIWKNRALHPTIPNALLQKALEKQNSTGSWCLGFDTPSLGQSSSGRHFSQKSVGHLGFSGTSFWIDFEKDIVIVLLTNRIHPTRNNTKIRQYRPFFHDYLMEVLITTACSCN